MSNSVFHLVYDHKGHVVLNTGSESVKHKLASSGSPLEFLADHLNENSELPEGANAHINNQASMSIKTKLTELLVKYKSLFPAELPFLVPPERGLDDKLYINLKEGT